MANFIWKIFSEYQLIFTILFMFVSFGLNFLYSNLHNSQVELKLSEIRSETVHSRIDGFAGTLSAFRDEAYRLEKEARDLQERNKLLIECIKRKDCQKYPQILERQETVKVDIAEAYKPIRQLLGETYTKEK